MKTCPHCGVIQTEDNSGKYVSGKRAGKFYNTCRSCQRAVSGEWYKNNREAHLERGRNYRALTDEAKILYHEKRKAESLDRCRNYKREWEKRREHTDLDYKLSKRLRHRVCQAMRGFGIKSARTPELVGCTVPELRSHLEKQFRPGMAWENYGPIWHIDHKRPCARFDLTDPAQQRECFHYTNLQPLFAEENLKKGAQYG